MGTAGTVRLDIVAQGRDEATRVLSRGNKALGKYTAQVRQNTGGLRRQRKAAMGARQAMQALAGAAVTAAIAKATKAGADFAGSMAVLEQTTPGAVSAMQQLASETGGVTVKALVEAQNKINAFGLDLKLNAALIETLRFRSIQNVRTLEDTIDSLVTGVARGSVAILDNLGIIVKASDAYKTYAAEIGTTANELSAQQKVAAVSAEVMRVLAKDTGRVEGTARDLGDAIARANNQIDKLSTTLAHVATPAVGHMAEGVSMLIDDVRDGVGALKEFRRMWDDSMEFYGTPAELELHGRNTALNAFVARLRADRAEIKRLHAEVKREADEALDALFPEDENAIQKQLDREAALLDRPRRERGAKKKDADQFSLFAAIEKAAVPLQRSLDWELQIVAARVDNVNLLRAMREEQARIAEEQERLAGEARAQPFFQMAESATQAQQAMSMLRPELVATMGAVAEWGGVWGEFARTQENANLAWAQSVGIGGMVAAAFVKNERLKAAILAPMAMAQGFLALPNLALAGPKFAAATLFGAVALTGAGTRGGSSPNVGGVGEPGGPLGAPIRTGGGGGSGGGSITVVFSDGILLGRPQDVGRSVQQALGSTRGTGIRARGV